MKRLYCILLCVMLFSACKKEENFGSVGDRFFITIPQSLNFDYEGGTQSVSFGEDILTACEFFQYDYEFVDGFPLIKVPDYGGEVSFPLVKDFGKCSVSITSHHAMDVTIPRQSDTERHSVHLVCFGTDKYGEEVMGSEILVLINYPPADNWE